MVIDWRADHSLRVPRPDLSQEIGTYSPASVPDAITVTAVTDFDGKPGGLGAPTCRAYEDDTLAEFSNFGAGADIAAPGVCLYSSWLGSGYLTASGTSAASPVVAGAAARYIAEHSKPTNRAGVLAIRDALVAGAFPQSSSCGFTDVDGIPEPLLSLNGSAFGGPGDCEETTGENQPPTAAFTYECVDLDCTFDGTASTDDSGIDTYTWSFGDGSSATGSTASHTYLSAGDFTVTLTVVDAEGLSDTVTQTLTVSVDPPNQPPTADFTFDCPDLNCTFDSATSSDDDGTIVGWQWTFGDGTGSDQPNPAHHYASSGGYEVSLTVIDDDGAPSLPTTLTVTVPNGTPTAAFTMDCTALTCTFDGSSSGDDGGIVSYDWSFGDETGATGQTASHVYAAAGDYLVTLTVTDGEGAQASTTQTASVAEPGPIQMFTGNAGFLWNPDTREATVAFWVLDENVMVVSDATVTGYWRWRNNGGKISTMAASAVSDTLGFAEIVTFFKKNQTPVEFCLTDVVKAGYEYTSEEECAGPVP